MNQKIKNYQSQIFNVFRRFPITVGFAIYTTIAFIALYLLEGSAPNFIENLKIDGHFGLWLTLHPVPAMALAYAIELFEEQRKKRNIPAHIIAQAIWLLILHLNLQLISQNPYESIFAVGFVIIASPFIVPFWKNSNDISLWKFAGQNIKSAAIAALVTAALNASVFFLFYAIGELFDIDFEEKVFVVSAIICWATISPILFLSGISKPGTDLEVQRNKFMANVIYFLFIPVFLLYVAFLYAYGIKIVSMDADYDMVTLFVSIAVISMLVITTIIYPSHFEGKRKLDRILLFVMPILTIPLVIFMTIDVALAFVNEAPDISLSLSAYLTLWYYAIIAITCICTKKKLRWIITSLCIAILFAYATPWSASNISRKIITARLDNILNKYGFSSFPTDCENYFILKEKIKESNSSDISKLEAIRHHISYNFGEKELEKYIPLHVDECAPPKTIEENKFQEIGLSASTLVLKPTSIPSKRSRATIFDNKIEEEFFTLKDSVLTFQITPNQEDSTEKHLYSIPLDTLKNKDSEDGNHNPLILEDSSSTFIVQEFNLTFERDYKALHFKGILYLE